VSATALATVLTVLLGGERGHVALRRSAQEKPVSGAGLALAAMVMGTVMYLVLAYAVGHVWAAGSIASGG
jgi:heme/copper-type cytochrome/quinol oxidase subunit 2